MTADDDRRRDSDDWGREEPDDRDRQESPEGASDAEPDAAETTVADAVRLVAGVAAIGGLGLTLVSGAVLAGAFATGDRSAVLRFGALAGGSVGLFLLWWGTAVLWSDDDRNRNAS